MANIKYVSTREDLKSAMNHKYDYIVVTDKKLADNISIVMSASEAAVTVAIGAAGVAAISWWNPLGWVAGAVAITSSTALTLAVAFLIVVLGASILWALYKNWKIVARGKIRLPDGSEIEGEIILSPS